MQKTFCVAGTDARQRAAARALRDAGYTVLGPGQAGVARYALLPMPLDTLTPEVSDVLGALPAGALALGGKVGTAVRRQAQQAGIELIDYFQRRDRTLWQSPILVLGYGRVGRAVARRLQALGAWVTVVARSAEQRASARCAGCRAAPLEQLSRLLPGFDAVVNTIPAQVLGRAELSCLPAGALVIDLASRPGGTDFAAARQLGIRAEHALSLPTRCAPRTAGELVADTVLNILRERGEEA